MPFVRGASVHLPRDEGAPDPSDIAAVRSWAAAVPKPRAIDLFCGAGGLSLGLRDAGFSVLVGADADRYAVETHTANIGGLGYVGDLSEPDGLLDHLEGWGIEEVELITGGVPCQPFSRAGQAKLKELARVGTRTRDDPRAGLWRSFMTVVERFRPPAVLIENVPDLPAWDDGAVLSGFLEALGELDYTVDARVLACADYGVPQHRARLILVGLRADRRFFWPEARPERVTLRDAIGDLPPVPGGQRADALPYRPRGGRRLTPFQSRMRRNLPSVERGIIHDHITRAVRPDDHEAYEGLQAGETYADVPARLQRYRSDIFTDKYKRLSWGEISRTVTAHIAKDGYWYIHPEQHRTLSVREAARLQTFPDSFRFAGQPSHRLAQIGNAVPPLLAEAVGDALRSALAERPAPSVGTGPPIRELLLKWYADRGSRHPWRGSDASPWAVVVGETCLDRSRVRASAESLQRILAIAPGPGELAGQGDRGLDRLLRAGLSRSRAERLQRIAEAIEERFDGEVPEDDLALRSLPGVGDGIAKSVLCFGFGRRTALLDAATARIRGRVQGHGGSDRWQLRLDLYRLAGPVGPDPPFNGALLELGSRVCRPTRPQCAVCPLRAECAYARASSSTRQDATPLTEVAV